MLPFFYFPGKMAEESVISLPEETSKHIVQVLRMKKGQKLQLTDGSGIATVAEIVHDQKKGVDVKVISLQRAAPCVTRTAIGISLVKNTSRFEWFLEKATELGIS